MLESRLKMMMYCSRMIAERDRKREGVEKWILLSYVLWIVQSFADGLAMWGKDK